MNENYEVNFEAMYPQLREALGDDFDVQQKFFEMMPKVANRSVNVTLNAVNKNIENFDMRDKLLVMNLLHTHHQLAAMLCKKYNLTVGEVEENG